MKKDRMNLEKMILRYVCKGQGFVCQVEFTLLKLFFKALMRVAGEAGKQLRNDESGEASGWPLLLCRDYMQKPLVLVEKNKVQNDKYNEYARFKY